MDNSYCRKKKPEITIEQDRNFYINFTMQSFDVSTKPFDSTNLKEILMVLALIK